jgi:hypothetical protein
MRTTYPDRDRLQAVHDSSFQVVCLFSLFGIVLSLIFFGTIAPAFDGGWTSAQLP